LENSAVRQVRAGSVVAGGKDLFLIAGPCVIEDEKSVFRHAGKIVRIAEKLRMPYIFKASFDKANRSSAKSFRGPGLEQGLEILSKVKREFGVPVLSDVHCVSQAEAAGTVLDVIQIPAFLCRQTDLLVAAAQTGKTVNVKKGQFMAPWDMKNAVEKIEKAGNRNILLTERGVSFGYNTLVSDFRAIPVLRGLGYPVIFDATHSVQRPGGLGQVSGGDREFIPLLARCGVAAGCDGIFLEVHENPSRAKSDGPNSVPLRELEGLLRNLLRLRRAL